MLCLPFATRRLSNKSLKCFVLEKSGRLLIPDPKNEPITLSAAWLIRWAGFLAPLFPNTRNTRKHARRIWTLLNSTSSKNLSKKLIYEFSLTVGYPTNCPILDALHIWIIFLVLKTQIWLKITSRRHMGGYDFNLPRSNGFIAKMKPYFTFFLSFG